MSSNSAALDLGEALVVIRGVRVGDSRIRWRDAGLDELRLFAVDRTGVMGDLTGPGFGLFVVWGVRANPYTPARI